MEIIHLVSHFGIGGDMVVIRAIAKAQAEQGDSVTVNTLPSIEFISNRHLSNPLPLNRGLRGLFATLKKLHTIPKSTDVLHAHSPIALLFALITKRIRCRTAVVVFTFHYPVPDSGVRRWLKTWLFNRADRIHAIASELKATLTSTYKVPKPIIHLIPLGIDPQKFVSANKSESNLKLRRRLGISADNFVIGYLGRLATEKNIDQLITFMDTNGLRFPDVHLIIAGTGDLENQLKQQALQSTTGKRIHFLGFTKRPEEIYPAFDLLLLPSAFEAFAIVVIEAAYCGVPTLRSEGGGSNDQINHGINGFVYSPLGGYKALESGVVDIFDRYRDQLPSIGAAARTHCLSLCAPDKFLTSINKLYHEAIGR